MRGKAALLREHGQVMMAGANQAFAKIVAQFGKEEEQGVKGMYDALSSNTTS